MLAESPYFMTNEEWYYYDEKEGCCKLTDKAPPEAVKSYEEFYAQMEQDLYGGDTVIYR